MVTEMSDSGLGTTQKNLDRAGQMITIRYMNEMDFCSVRFRAWHNTDIVNLI